ncbi:GntR family transcriptional regulator [Streptomyces sp. B1866]|uniref:GntR family transcriptional regulator n=1 Tax=Streptomyces sp. B1866 TaxID=3075431 RepID=UPI00288C7AC0|nr:GntR family transcriptional regulator [Streptomyces sp. B1866]MDT3398706.1 GntR family transcriptional regulator [Streptomyces sp. B1866]
MRTGGPGTAAGRPLTRTGQVAQAVRKLVAEGTWPPGYRIQVGELARDHGLHAETVRLALRALVAERILTAAPRQGFWVRDPTQDDGDPPDAQQRFTRAMRRAIADGTYPPGTVLPSQGALCRLFGSNRNAVSRGMRSLRAEGLVEIQSGVGTRVIGEAPPARPPSPPYDADRPPLSKRRAVADAVRRAIADGTLTPGSRLPQADLGQRYGASLSTVGRAMADLRAEGLVEGCEGQGVWVAGGACPAPSGGPSGDRPVTAVPSGGGDGDRVARLLQDRIVSGAYPPGRRLVLADLAREHGVTAHAARRALTLLRAAGLVDRYRRRGTFVRDLPLPGGQRS